MIVKDSKARGPDAQRQADLPKPRTLRRWRATIGGAAATVLVAGGLLFGAATPANAAVSACDSSAWVKGSAAGITGWRISAIYDMPIKFYGGGVVEWRCTMRYGSGGYGVKRLQQTLNDCHRSTTGTWLSVDGKFGPRTREALIRVQRAYRITADGIYGPQTAGTIAHPVYSSDNAGWRCATYRA